MPNNQIEEVQYCNHCGSANKKSAYECTECKKKIHTRYKPVYDFLKKHAKKNIKDRVGDTIFVLVKNFLFSHLYGTVLTITIVAAAVSTVYATQPYVEKVSEKPGTEADAFEVQIADFPEFTESDLISFDFLACTYDCFVDPLRSSYSYWDEEVSYCDSAEDVFAENNIPNFNYDVVHEMIQNPISMELPANGEYPDYMITREGHDKAGPVIIRKAFPETAVQGRDCTTNIAKRLLADGYRVAENDYVLEESAYFGDTIFRRLVYKMVYVQYKDRWYIVEDRLAEMIE